MVIALSYYESIALYIIVFFLSANASKIKINKIMKVAAISLLPLLIASFRYNVGWDYGSYVWGFEVFNPDTSILEMITSYKMGDSIGLNLVMKFAKLLNSQLLFFAITSGLSIVPIFCYFLDEWNDEKKIIPLSIFVVGFTMFFNNMSAIKQGIAIGFCFYSLKYVYHRKFVKYMICLLVAFLFHSTALVFLPVYFFCGLNQEIKWWKKIGIIGISFTFIIFFEQLIGIVGGERFDVYANDILITNNYMFYLMLILLIIFVIFKNKLISLDSRNELLIILYTVAVVLMLFGFRNAFVKRIALYFSSVEVLLMPQMVFIFNKQSRKIVTVLIGIFYVLVCMILNSGTAESMAPIPYSIIIGEYL